MQMRKAHQPHVNIDIERSLQLTKIKFDDLMYVQDGFTGRQLQRALFAHGIYAAHMAMHVQDRNDKIQRLKDDFSKFKE